MSKNSNDILLCPACLISETVMQPKMFWVWEACDHWLCSTCFAQIVPIHFWNENGPNGHGAPCPDCGKTSPFHVTNTLLNIILKRRKPAFASSAAADDEVIIPTTMTPKGVITFDDYDYNDFLSDNEYDGDGNGNGKAAAAVETEEEKEVETMVVEVAPNDKNNSIGTSKSHPIEVPSSPPYTTIDSSPLLLPSSKPGGNNNSNNLSRLQLIRTKNRELAVAAANAHKLGVPFDVINSVNTIAELDEIVLQLLSKQEEDAQAAMTNAALGKIDAEEEAKWFRQVTATPATNTPESMALAAAAAHLGPRSQRMQKQQPPPPPSTQ